MQKSKRKLFTATLAATVATGALVAAVPTFAQAAQTKTFSDVKNPNVHYYAPIYELTANGVINGYEDSTFRPGANISRAHAAKIMALALDLDVENVKDPGFKDVPKTHPYYGHIAALVEEGIIRGYEDKTFRPSGLLTRAHTAQLLVLGYDIEEETLNNLPFKDINSKQWFANYIQTLYVNDITTGTTPTTFTPNANVTRGQFASFIHRTGNAFGHAKKLEELKALIKSAEALNAADYTTETWEVLQEELEKAKEVANDSDAERKDVNHAIRDLNKAIKALEKDEAPVGGGGGGPSGPTAEQKFETAINNALDSKNVSIEDATVKFDEKKNEVTVNIIQPEKPLLAIMGTGLIDAFTSDVEGVKTVKFGDVEITSADDQSTIKQKALDAFKDYETLGELPESVTVTVILNTGKNLTYTINFKQS